MSGTTGSNPYKPCMQKERKAGSNPDSTILLRTMKGQSLPSSRVKFPGANTSQRHHPSRMLLWLPPREKGLAAVLDKGHSAAHLPGHPPSLLITWSPAHIYSFPCLINWSTLSHNRTGHRDSAPLLFLYQTDMILVSCKVGRQTDTRARGVSMCVTPHISITLDIWAPVGNSQSTLGSPLCPAPCLVLFRGHDIYTDGSQTYWFKNPDMYLRLAETPGHHF